AARKAEFVLIALFARDEHVLRADAIGALATDEWIHDQSAYDARRRVRCDASPDSVANPAILRHESDDIHAGGDRGDCLARERGATLTKLVEDRPGAVVVMRHEPAIDVVVERGDRRAAKDDKASDQPILSRRVEWG